jgi:glycosyltransferase involved in cell wall biosynthesis
MRIAHVAIATPGMCGLYETTRELAAAERELGVDARIVDPQPTPFHPGEEDRGVPMADTSFLAKADVVADHSGIDKLGLERRRRPIVYVNHGRPASSFAMERNGGPPALSYWYKRDRDKRYRVVTTFWPEHVPYLEGIWSNTPVRAVSPPTDLERWSPGPTPYDFAGQGGDINVVIADMWRDDVTPFPCIAAFLKFGEENPTARLHLYGLPDDRSGIEVFLQVLRDRGQLGVAQGHARALEVVYRAADLVISPQRIYTRTLRESMACGAQVVSGRDADPADLCAFVEAMEDRLSHPRDTRSEAESLFDPVQTATQFLEVVSLN